jgi:hypothetical protein
MAAGIAEDSQHALFDVLQMNSLPYLPQGHREYATARLRRPNPQSLNH